MPSYFSDCDRRAIRVKRLLFREALTVHTDMNIPVLPAYRHPNIPQFKILLRLNDIFSNTSSQEPNLFPSTIGNHHTGTNTGVNPNSMAQSAQEPGYGRTTAEFPSIPGRDEGLQLLPRVQPNPRAHPAFNPMGM